MSSLIRKKFNEKLFTSARIKPTDITVNVIVCFVIKSIKEDWKKLIL